MADSRSCPSCGYTPSAEDERVVGRCVPGYHELALVGHPAPGEMPLAVEQFLRARAAAAVALLTVREVRRRVDRLPAHAVFHAAEGHAGRVCASLLRDGNAETAMTYALAAEMLAARATKARERVEATLTVLRGAA